MLVMAQCYLFITRNGKHDLNGSKACDCKVSGVHPRGAACIFVAHKDKVHADSPVATG